MLFEGVKQYFLSIFENIKAWVAVQVVITVSYNVHQRLCDYLENVVVHNLECLTISSMDNICSGFYLYEMNKNTYDF